MTIDEQWHKDVDVLLEAVTLISSLIEQGSLKQAVHVLAQALRDQESVEPHIHRIYLTGIQLLNNLNELLQKQERETERLQQELETKTLLLENVMLARIHLLAYSEHQSTQLTEILRASFDARNVADGEFAKTVALPLIHYFEALSNRLRPLLGEKLSEVDVALKPLKTYLATLTPLVSTVAIENVPLAKREIEVLQYLVQGLSAVEAGKHLHVEASTIRTYRRRIMQKLDIHHLPGLVKYALRHNLTTLNE